MSPIETMLLGALREAVPNDWTICDETQPADEYLEIDGEQLFMSVSIGEGKHVGSLSANVPLGTYRADFVIEIDKVKVAIECDGHEFHDRTKQQAAYDRARDRELLLLGVTTIRFTGSEIFHSPERCASEVYAIVEKLREHEEVAFNFAASSWEAGQTKGREDCISEILAHRKLVTVGLMAGVL